MPRMEPRVWRRDENCSATETMAVDRRDEALVMEKVGGEKVGKSGETSDEGGRARTEETRMRSHISTLQHLSEPPKRTDDTLDDLERRLRALAEAIRQAIGIVRIHPRLHSHASHPSVHASHSSHPSHAAHSAVHGPVPAHASIHRGAHAAEARVRR